MSAICDRDTFQRIAMAAVDYACGRASYVPSVVCRYLRGNLGALDPDTEREILAIISKRAAQGPDALGWEIDRTCWQDFARALETNLKWPAKRSEPNTANMDTFWLMVGSALRRDKRADVPYLWAADYADLVRENEGTIPDKWVQNLLRDVAEAYGTDWMPEVGPERDPAGFRELHELLASLFKERTGEELPPELSIRPINR